MRPGRAHAEGAPTDECDLEPADLKMPLERLGDRVDALLSEANEAAERSAAVERAAIEDIEDEQARQLAGPCGAHTAA